MIHYTVMCDVDAAVAQTWLAWLVQIHIPDMLATGCIVSADVTRLEDPPSLRGERFVARYTAPDRATWERYLSDHAPALRGDHIERFGGRVTAERTLGERVA